MDKVLVKYDAWMSEVRDTLEGYSDDMSVDEFYCEEWNFNWFEAFVAGWTPRDALNNAFVELDKRQAALAA